MTETLAKLAARVLAQSSKNINWENLTYGPQLGVGSHTGSSTMVLLARAARERMRTDKSLAVLSVDIAKAFPNISRRKVIEGHLELGQAHLAWEAQHRLALHTNTYLPWGGLRPVATGVQQGHPLSPHNFAAANYLRQKQAFEMWDEDEPLEALFNVNYADDNLFAGPLEDSLRYLHGLLSVEEEYGAKVSLKKTRLYVVDVEQAKRKIRKLVERWTLDRRILTLQLDVPDELCTTRIPVGNIDSEVQALKESLQQTQIQRDSLAYLEYPQIEYSVLRQCLSVQKLPGCCAPHKCRSVKPTQTRLLS